MKSLGIVFLHGAGLGSYIWNDMRPIIKSEALYVDFPNRGTTEYANKGLSFRDYLNHVINQITQWKVNEFIVVTHSISGCVGLKLLEHFETQIHGFIAISAAIPNNNTSFIQQLPFPQKLIVPILLKLFGTKPPKKSILRELCHDLSQSQSDKVVKNFTAESKLLFTSQVNYKYPLVPKINVKLLGDKSFPVSIQDRMVKNLVPENVIELESGHLPMMSQPEKLAEIANNFIKNIHKT